MDHPGTQVWTWTLFGVLLCWMGVTSAAPGPHYTVTIPAVLEARTDAVFCASLMQPNETLTMTTVLKFPKINLTVLEENTDKDFKKCMVFQVPEGHNEIGHMEVEVKGPTFYSKEVRKVMIKTYKPMTFIQTDKPIYIPGQTVHFRVVSLDTKLRPVSQLYSQIQIEQPNGNKIGQWLNETSDGKILQLSYKLSSEAREGTYDINLLNGEDKTKHNFKVEKYVLPKFEVKINTTSEINIKEEELKAEVCAKYTYGQSVPGNIKAKLCRPLALYYKYSDGEDELDAPCFIQTKMADKFGCAEFFFKTSTFLKLDPKILQDLLQLEAEVTEEGTEITQTAEKKIEISYVVAKLSFGNTPKIYEKGKEIIGEVSAVHYNNTPVPNMMLYLFEGKRWNAHLIQELTTDSNGVAAFRYTPAVSPPELSLYLSNKRNVEDNSRNYYDGQIEPASHTLSLVQESSPDSKTVSSLEVQTKDGPLHCDAKEYITVKYTIVGEKQGSASVSYMVLSKGAIVNHGFAEIQVQDQPVTEGQMSLELTVSQETAPTFQVVVYAILPSETVIASRADFNTDKCFSHKVSLDFSKDSVVPGEENTLKLTAHRDALCGVSIVDRSVFIKEPKKTLDADKIFDLLPYSKSSSLPYTVHDEEECLDVRPKRHIRPPGGDIDDPYSVFQGAGLKMATNLHVRVPTCLRYGGRDYTYKRYPYLGYAREKGILMSSVSEQYERPSPIETVRTFFPETWIWDLMETGATGTTDMSLIAPDTITTWETEAFCLSSQGFGLAPRKELTVFQPFFLELSMPYSITRGENFELKATVFNYLSSCIMVSVKPTPTFDYSLAKIPGVEYATCVCSNERKTFKWVMTPATLGDVMVSVTAEAQASHVTCNNEVVTVPERGHSDTVSKTLKVKAEGVEQKKTTSWLLCPMDQVMTEEVSIQLPDNAINGSSKALVSVIGDFMGRALHGLDHLLQMPYGCGEQNMARLAPNIYVLRYLNDTNQLAPDIMQKGVGHMTTGYQRQLNYKLFSGAFSTYGAGIGNSWLTAFVMKSFVKAKSFIFIDEDVIDDAISWLQGKQMQNGCYEQQGKVFNNAMKGGVSDEVTHSAYITAAFLETNSTVTESVSRCLSCLKNSHNDLSNTYATALQAYVFALAGDLETREKLLQHLDKVAIKDGGFIHWSQTATDSSNSLSVEMSAYVLLAVLTGPTSAETLGYASNIVRWLTSQQNYYGGFSSTQDTVVALQALSLYSTLVVRVGGSGTVTVQSSSGQLEFSVNEDNKLIYQEQVLKDVTGKYQVKAEGTACASVQISHHYNIPDTVIHTTLNLDVATKAPCDIPDTQPSMTLTAKCLFTGDNSPSNMLILDIKMLSGFVPDSESLKKLRRKSEVERVEYSQDHVLLYIKELTKDKPASYELELLEVLPVTNLKPAVIKIYDYYQPAIKGQNEYSFPCAAA